MFCQGRWTILIFFCKTVSVFKMWLSNAWVKLELTSKSPLVPFDSRPCKSMLPYKNMSKHISDNMKMNWLATTDKRIIKACCMQVATSIKPKIEIFDECANKMQQNQNKYKIMKGFLWNKPSKRHATTIFNNVIVCTWLSRHCGCQHCLTIKIFLFHVHEKFIKIYYCWKLK